MWVNWFQWAKSKTRVPLNTLCSRAVVTHWINTSLSISWEETEPGAGEDGRGREGEVLLLLLAGPQRHRQREGNIGADDGGAGRGAGSTGTSNSVCVCVYEERWSTCFLFAHFLYRAVVGFTPVLFHLPPGSGPAGERASVLPAVLQRRDGRPLREERRGGGKLTQYVHIAALRYHQSALTHSLLPFLHFLYRLD